MEFILILFEEGIEKYMVSEFFAGFVQKNNMLVGILICALFTSIIFEILYYFLGFLFNLSFLGIVFLADIYLIIGNCVGLYVTFKNRKETQSHIKTGLIVGLVGSFLSLFLIGLIDWIIFTFIVGFNLFLFLEYFLYLLYFYGIFYILVGLILGYLFGNRYKKRENADILAPRF